MKPKIIISILLLNLVIVYPINSQTFYLDFLQRVQNARDSVKKSNIITDYLMKNKIPIIDGNNVYFIYRGPGKFAAVPGELNGWKPELSMMKKVDKTDLFYFIDTLDVGGRAEYKIWVDSVWMLDPQNPQKALGGFGFNSEFWMPDYLPPKEIEYDDGIPHGRIDTIRFESKILKRTHPVLIYQPFTKLTKNLPVVYVNDGGEYLSIVKMNNVIDNLISSNRIKPLLGVFIDPRTDPSAPETNMRMKDYSASEDYLRFLTDELVPFIDENYPTSKNPKDRLIMGASMGGLISTFVSYKRPDVFKNSAAQSPAYMGADAYVVAMIAEGGYTDINVYIDTGILQDTKIESRIVKALLLERGIKINYAEYPEGHNWTNWQARLDDILEYFFLKDSYEK